LASGWPIERRGGRAPRPSSTKDGAVISESETGRVGTRIRSVVDSRGAPHLA